MAGRIMNVHLLGALEASEEAAHDLARSYSEVEQRVNERTLDLIKERYRLNEALRELTVARDRAEAASRAKSAFLANMSHELRTPLTTILGYTALIEHEIASLSNPTLESDLSRISGAGNHLLGLISDVLDLAEVEAGTLQLNPEPFALGELIDDMLASTRPLVVRKNNQLDLIYDGDPCTLRHDRSKVRQILVNLLSNAAKFTEHGSITLEVSRQTASQFVDSDQQPRPDASTGDQPATGGLVVFKVTDTGIGIAPEQVRQILHPFAQGDAAIKYMYGGAGLGLAICHRYAQLMGGDIAVDSVEGRGTICTVYLPLEQRSAPSAPEQPADTSDSVEPAAAVIYK
jgi:signal transduction histidine kinase